MSQWVGAKSQRFGPTRKILGRRYTVQEQEFLLPPAGLLALKDKGKKEQGINEKRHFEEKFGEVGKERRLCFHKTASLVTLSRDKGLKHLSPTFTSPHRRAERLHIRQEFPDIGGTARLHMHMVRDETGDRPQDRLSQDYDFHVTMMGRKGRVMDQRNGLPVASLGDKIYGVVQASPGYFSQEGLFPTCTYRHRVKASHLSPTGLYDTVQSYAATSPSRVTWKKRLLREEQAQEQQDLADLITWERTTLKEIYPNRPDPDETDEDN